LVFAPASLILTNCNLPIIRALYFKGSMRKLIGLSFLAFVSGCVSPPQIIKNDTSASIFVTTSTLEKNTIHPDETIFVRVFTPDQSLFYDAPLSVITLKPKKTNGSFYLDSEVAYKIMIHSTNSGTFSSSSCSTVMDITPNQNGVYKIQFNVNVNVNEPNNECSLIFSDGDKELINKSFIKNKSYIIPIPIPLPI
jgi:hypothetical protein